MVQERCRSKGIRAEKWKFCLIFIWNFVMNDDGDNILRRRSVDSCAPSILLPLV